jgi:hypothetical protein
MLIGQTWLYVFRDVFLASPLSVQLNALLQRSCLDSLVSPQRRPAVIFAGLIGLSILVRASFCLLPGIRGHVLATWLRSSAYVFCPSFRSDRLVLAQQ